MMESNDLTSNTATPFGGFREDNMNLIRLPEAFFTQLLPIIDDLIMLRLLMYMFWHLEQQDNPVRYFRLEDLKSDPTLIRMTGGEHLLEKALKGLVELGVVLEALLAWMEETYYFLNGPQGRAAVEAIKNGRWQGSNKQYKPIHMKDATPNIFKLYEENIGPITPMIADILKLDEAAYPASWIHDAIQMAVKNNARNWKYVQAILTRWQNKGRENEQFRQDDSQDPSSYRESWLGRK